MSNYPVLPNAPVTEAIFDIKTKFDNAIDIDELNRIHDEIISDFPQREVKRAFEASFRLQPGKDISNPQIHKDKPIGLVLKNEENSKVVQAGVDGFTFNKLKPYEEWEVFFSEAKRLWEIYLNIAKPSSIQRFSLRYINQIEIPLPFNEFEEYLYTMPKIAPKLPQTFSNFFMRIEIPFEKEGVHAIIHQALRPVLPTNKLPIIYDIDVIKIHEYKVTDDSIWSDFEVLRKIKDDIFFGSLTDKTMEMFK